MSAPLDARPGSDRGPRLDSWKEIAAHLGRDIRTVHRWERGEGLPVHRHLHDKLGSVYAYGDELDRWRSARSTRPDESGVTTAVAREDDERPGASAHPESATPAQVVVWPRRWDRLPAVGGPAVAVVLVGWSSHVS